MSRRRGTVLEKRLDVLEKQLGPQEVRMPRDALGLVLWENVAYLVDDERRARVFKSLKQRVGLGAAALRAARPETLLEIAALGGMHPAQRVDKLRDIADLVLDEFGGDLEAVLERPARDARRALKRFPGIGEPGADKILLFTGTEPVLALDSNALRVLLRLGYGTESKNYAQSYKSAQRAAEVELERTCAARQRAYDLLRRHGQTLCKSKAPECDACPLEAGCEYARGERG